MCAHNRFAYLSCSADSCRLQYNTLHAEKVLRANIANLKMAISDQNLELIPDYEQRIEVLQDLKFIDENSTVLLKGRVACEVQR
jgi:antiviral helicase SKI2